MATGSLGLSTSFLPGHDTLLRRRRRRPPATTAASFRPVTAELGGSWGGSWWRRSGWGSLHGDGVRRRHLPQHAPPQRRAHHHRPRRGARPRRRVLPLVHPRRRAGLLRHVRARLRRARLPPHLPQGERGHSRRPNSSALLRLGG